MLNVKNFSLIAAFALLALAVGCNVSTANLSSLKMSTDKAGATETNTFKAGDTIYAKAQVANNPGKVKVKLYLADPKGTTMQGSEVNLEIDGDGSANYTLPTTEAIPSGSYKLTADMINDAGEKKDTKTAAFTITDGAE